MHERWHPILELLAEESGFAVLLTAYSHGDVINLDRLESRHVLQMPARVGQRVPAYAVATGRPLLAYQPEEEIERVLGGGLQRYTDATITSPEALRAELRTIREEGVAVDRGEWRDLIWAVGAPVFDEHLSAAFAVGVFGLAAEIQQAPLERLIRLVHGAAQAISRALGAPAYPSTAGAAERGIAGARSA